jgi:cyanophycinase
MRIHDPQRKHEQMNNLAACDPRTCFRIHHLHVLHRIGATSWSLLCLVALALIAPPPSRADETIGPEKGTLVIVGGGDRDYVNFRHFVDLAGGKDAKLVVVPTASSTKEDYDYSHHRAALFAREELGMTNVTVVHTHDRDEADSDAFVQPICNADAIWFTGGRQWRIADAYLGTRSEREFQAVLDRGGVIGGSSAGASIQGSFLVRGDTSGSNVMIGDHQQGLAYIKHSAIDQHLIPRARQGGLIEVLTDPRQKMEPSIDRHSLLGIGIDEATAIVVRGNTFEVVGKEDGVVLLYDPRMWNEEMPDRDRYQILWTGAQYDLKDRCVLHPGTPPHPQIAQRPEGFYKDVFMDGGVNLSSRKSLPAAESMGLSYERYAGKDPQKQRELLVGSDLDANGVLLYPDGQPRFRLLYVNGGGATKHGLSLGGPGRAAVVDFYNGGGSYCGSCAGSFLSGVNTDSNSVPRDGYLHLFPYNTLNTGLKKARVGHRIPASSPLLDYRDFGGDYYVADIYHNNGNWLATSDLERMHDVEVLATYDTPTKKTHEGVAIWAWKKNESCGRIVNIGSHPEGISSGERLALTEACFAYAVDGMGCPQLKAHLKDGVVRVMNKGTAENDPSHTRIGDRQYHHFTFDVDESVNDVQLDLVGLGDLDLNLFLDKAGPAFESTADIRNTTPGASKQIRQTLTPGRWYVSVECATTVDAILDETQSYFIYRGDTDVLNGIAYSIRVQMLGTSR